MDISLERLTNMTLDMARLSDNTVSKAINAYREGKDAAGEIFRMSEELRILQDEVSELAVELIARYQPVASDLRFIKSCMETAYGFSRFGRYALDISEVVGVFGDLSMCDKSAVEAAGAQAKEMIQIGIKAFAERDVSSAKKLDEMDSVVDKIYLDFLQGAAAQRGEVKIRCTASALLILRFLERIADHATYIGESVLYIVTGERSSRR